MTPQQKKQHIIDLAAAKKLQVASVRLGQQGYGFFVKRNGRVLHDQAFDFEEAVCFLENYDVGIDSRRQDEH